MDELALTGRDQSFLSDALERPVHQELVLPFTLLRDAGRQQGFEIAIASGFRDFERQKAIWNAKVKGERPVLDSGGKPVDITSLDGWSLVELILRWSALPGASRHHWGTEIDIYDRAAVPEDYAVQLSVEEVRAGGPFAAMHDWLDDYLQGQADFCRPYDKDRGGVAPERWHLSYAPLSSRCQQQLAVDTLRALYQDQSILLAEVVCAHLDEIYERFVSVPVSVYPARHRL